MNTKGASRDVFLFTGNKWNTVGIPLHFLGMLQSPHLATQHRRRETQRKRDRIPTWTEIREKKEAD